MVDASELARLLSLVAYNARLNAIEGLDVFRRLLEKDSDGQVLQFLKREMPNLEGKRRGGVAFAIAEHYRQTGDLTSLQRLFAIDDDDVKKFTLNALWGEPGANPQMGPGIVRMAIGATDHPSPEVRIEACYVFQNQCANGVDVSGAVAPLRSLLDDENSGVRRQAAFAVGNLAKGKYDVSRHVAALRRNVRHADKFVRDPSAWALWQLSRRKHDISAAVAELVESLTDGDDWDGPRKNSAGALLHHAKKTPENAERVKRCVKSVALDQNRKEIKRFLEQLDNLK